MDGQLLNVRYRCVECGNRQWTDKSTGWQIVGGVKGTWKEWDFDFSGFYAKGTTTETPTGGIPVYVTTDGSFGGGILPLLNSGQVNVFGPNTPAVQQLIQNTMFNQKAFDLNSSNYGFEAKGSGDIWKLPAGPLALALGYQWRKETLEFNFPDLLQTGVVSHYGANFLPVDADRTVNAVFAEFNIPIVKGLEANAAVRWDHYSDFGSTTNPKFSVRWNPVTQLLFRGSWNKAFIAPSLTQLFGPNQQGTTAVGLSYPIRCPVTNDANDCDTQFNALFGGNKDLKPQTATNWTVGAVFEPVVGVSFSFDWFNIDTKNSFVNGINQNVIFDPATFPQYANLVTRGAPDPNFPNLPGRITSVDQRFVNLGETRIDGFDVNARVRFPQTAFGRFTLNVDGTYYNKYEQSQPDGSFAGFVSNAFGNGTSGIFPRYKQYATLTWEYGPWSATLGNLYQASYIDVLVDGNDNQRRVGSMSLWDIQASYTGLKNWKFTVGAQNVFDRDPPFTNSNLQFQTGYDPTYYNPLARVIWAQVGYSFRP